MNEKITDISTLPFLTPGVKFCVSPRENMRVSATFLGLTSLVIFIMCYNELLPPETICLRHASNVKESLQMTFGVLRLMPHHTLQNAR